MAEHQDLAFKVMMEDESFDGKPPSNSEVLARVSSLEFGFLIFTSAVKQYPNRNIQLRHGAEIKRRHDGAPKLDVPPARRDPNLKSWSVNLIGGKKMEHLGFVEAIDEPSALKAAAEKFTHLTEAQRRRLAVNPSR